MSARPEGCSAGAPETGASAWPDPVDRERLHRDSEGHRAAVPVPHGSARRVPLSTDPTVPCALCKRGHGSRPNPPSGLPSLNPREAWPPVGLYLVPPSPPPPRVCSAYQLLDAPAGLRWGPRSYADGHSAVSHSEYPHSPFQDSAKYPAPNLTGFH